jgi:hypothetical protein
MTFSIDNDVSADLFRKLDCVKFKNAIDLSQEPESMAF